MPFNKDALALEWSILVILTCSAYWNDLLTLIMSTKGFEN